MEAAPFNVELATMRAGKQILFENGMMTLLFVSDIHKRSPSLKCDGRLPGDLDLTGFTHMNFGEKFQNKVDQLSVEVESKTNCDGFFIPSIRIFQPYDV